MLNMKKLFLWVAFILYLCLLIKIIFYKNYIGSIQYPDYYGVLSVYQNFERANFVPFKTIWELISVESGFFAFENITGNILLFLPLGVFLPILMPAFTSFRKTLAIGFFLSLSFELIQLITVLGFFDIDDTILNTLGSVIGYFIWRIFSFYKK